MNKLPTATKKEPMQAKDIAKQIYQNLQAKKKDESLIPDVMKFNKSFDEIFK
jgi:hypothetical protein